MDDSDPTTRLMAAKLARSGAGFAKTMKASQIDILQRWCKLVYIPRVNSGFKPCGSALRTLVSPQKAPASSSV